MGPAPNGAGPFLHSYDSLGNNNNNKPIPFYLVYLPDSTVVFVY